MTDAYIRESVDGITFDDANIAASFQTDAEKRTVTGMFVPWGQVARSGLAKWRFARGSLRWATERRIKLNLGHDHKEAVGVATRIDNGTAGLYGTFKIARGEQGDRALALAEDGVLDGFSIEVDFDEDDGWTPDPDDDDVRLVQSGRLAGVALTAFPAFDDARVDRVAATREGVAMADDKKDDKQEMEADESEARFDGMLQGLANKVVDSQQKLNAEMAQSVGESISEGVKTALENIGDPQRGSVKAARYTVTREEPTYRFDGTGHSLVRDAWYAASQKEEDAIDRLRRYRRQTEEVATLVNQNFLSFAPQTTTTASQIIPPGYRPELYVPQLQQERPYVSAVSQGTLANATPFTVPTFTSVGTGSADHVEGTNPSDGSLTFGTKTVTPQAISGRLVLTREIVDASNPAIDQIAFAAMRESYNRQTEVKVYTLLNGTSGAGGTITAGFVPSGAQAVTVAGGTDNQGLVKQIRKSLADYTFARFAAPTVALMGQGATARLAQAVDTTQRPLFPWADGTNTFGTANAAAGGYQVDSLRFVPAWSNTGTAAGDSQIMILNRSDVWVWESPLLQFRFEEKQGPANIELNIFGYFATHLLRPVGLSGIRIT
ncbi:MAG: phage major capsid protein [Actinomycetota bacterium]|nr:phage major capsid protein [Actinomycetota bacterium]